MKNWQFLTLFKGGDTNPKVRVNTYKKFLGFASVFFILWISLMPLAWLNLRIKKYPSSKGSFYLFGGERGIMRHDPKGGGFKSDKKFLGCASAFFYPPDFAQACGLAHPSDKKIPFFEGSFLSVWRRERDSNPRYLAVYTLSRRASSATPAPLPKKAHK